MKFHLEIEIDNGDLRKHIADRRSGQSKRDAYIEITDCILNGLSCIDAMVCRVSGGHIPLVIGDLQSLSEEDAEVVDKMLTERKK